MRKLICLALLLLPAIAEAQERRFELTPFGSFRFDGNIDLRSRIINPNLDIDDSFAYGLILNIPLTSNLQLEILANRQDSELIEDSGLFGSGSTTVADIEITHLHVGVLAQFGHGQILPFVVGTVGIANLDVQGPEFGSDERVAVSGGGGVKILFSDHIGIRLEGRLYYIDLDDNDDNDFTDQDSLTQAEVSLGLIFAW